MSGGRELYVYWRVAPGDRVAAVADLRAMQAELRAAWPELQARMLQRAGGDAADSVTLMETYAAAQGVDCALQARVAVLAAERLARWCVGERHVEVFEPAG